VSRCLCETDDVNRSAKFFTVALVIAVVAVVSQFARGPWTISRVIGLLLMLGGGVVMTIARIQLGKSFSISPKATEMVTGGIYSRIRNPVYVFGMILLAGVILCLDRPRLLWIF
jgi:protein-S-isoprenylcysteine O-methyltransferase Ste14